MPSKNVLKIYVENGYYHIYNRGFEKRKIFLDKNDYFVFKYFLRRSVDPELKVKATGLINTHNISDEIGLICYCLMPNHFHLLLKQRTKNSVTKLLRRVLTSYVMYFNKKYNREGSLFQGKPRGILIQNENYLLHLSRYIHTNPLEIIGNKPLEKYPYSSYRVYLGIIKDKWLSSSEIVSFFKSAQKTSLSACLSYKGFVENYEKDPKGTIGSLALE